MRAALVLLALFNILSSVQARSYVLDPAKLSLTTVDGSSRFSKDLTAPPTPGESETPSQLEPDDVIRLAFSLKIDGEPKWNKEHTPHQAVVVLSNPGTDKAVSWPLTVKPASGKVSWNLRVDRIPLSLSRNNSSKPLTLSLLLANFPSSSDPTTGTYEPLSLDLLHFLLPDTLTSSTTSATVAVQNLHSPREKAEIEQGFQGWPSNQHTFSIPPTDTMPPRHISAIASLVTAAVPWSILLVLLFLIKPSLSVPTTRISLLLTCLVGLEALALQYWISLTLFQMLPYLFVGGLLTLLVGKSALADLRQRRLASKK